MVLWMICSPHHMLAGKILWLPWCCSDLGYSVIHCWFSHSTGKAEKGFVLTNSMWKRANQQPSYDQVHIPPESQSENDTGCEPSVNHTS